MTVIRNKYRFVFLRGAVGGRSDVRPRFPRREEKRAAVPERDTGRPPPRQQVKDPSNGSQPRLGSRVDAGSFLTNMGHVDKWASNYQINLVPEPVRAGEAYSLAQTRSQQVARGYFNECLSA
ncbi:hypothetical protein SKAU_G00206290 [Synaphobranchus kaupii]|uniref:Uncharacterized protein n=1 Tax=Synaphobranchus kaupii TaxID=118154 RepID=A0A9Q1IYV3_SYNKA|nr:hypothetical protein SKAU_G00206290 [Synaphobranchus kaupii]